MRLPDTQGLLLVIGLALAVVGLSLEPRAAVPQGDGTTPPVDPQNRHFPVLGMSDSNSDMIAVTGVDLTGTSILYLIDTKQKQMAVYQASGGSEGTQNVKLVGARRIDLDLRLEGFNDKSKYSRQELEKRFHESPGSTPPK